MQPIRHMPRMAEKRLICGEHIQVGSRNRKARIGVMLNSPVMLSGLIHKDPRVTLEDHVQQVPALFRRTETNESFAGDR